MRQTLKSPHVLLVLLVHQAFAGATVSGSGDQPSTREGNTQCSQLNQKLSQCANVFQRNVQVFANTTSLPTDALVLSPHLDAGKVNETCRSVVTAWECYYSYPPCHSARDAHSQLPVCSQQCMELSKLMTECYLSYEAVLGNISGDVDTLLTELLVFVEELNCSDPDSFKLTRLPVNQNGCTALYLTSTGQVFNKLPEIVVLCLIVGAAICLISLLLLILCVVVVCLRRKRRNSKSRVACSQQPNNVTTLRRLDSPNPSATIERFPSSEEVNVRSDVQVAKMITDRKRRHYVSLYTGSFIPYQHLELHSLIGEGAYGKVSEGVWKDPSTKIEKRVAIKTLRSFSSEQQLNTLFTESRAMRDFDHPNVMKFLGMCFDAPEGYPYIILPFMANGSLLDYLKKKTSSSTPVSSVGGYPEGLELEVLFQFCVDVVDGMTYLIQQKFVHRDLAARNCMVSDTKTILIGDFGLAEDLYSRDQKQCEVRLPLKWMPPESLRDGVSNERTDMVGYYY
ncbi:Tyrosine-protein kinase transforming protein ros [Geodia barretti]|uniref:Tyrosine-protein kinase transforming protein ros n=1 Tax=Geodia barretti TaxID=519541 RepID=A0AA35S5H9_GEOBA|nr:Tyrosine-protein kinase transforming protein ros [Geodia barretti]